MSTRSVVAVPHGDIWRGRYVHFDGYPQHLATTLFRLVRRDGVDKVSRTLTEDHTGWSMLNDDQHQISQNSARFVVVPGYGIAYRENDSDGLSDWFGPEDIGYWIEWVYVLTPGGLLVIQPGYEGPDTLHGHFDWSEDHDWNALNNGYGHA